MKRGAFPASARYNPAIAPSSILGNGPMSTESQGSVSHWIDALKAGDGGAAQQLWERYFGELVRLARARLPKALRAQADEEDIALSAFHSLCQGVARGRFPQLDDRHGLWRLLVTITMRKAVDESKKQGSQKRGGGRVVGEAALAGGDPDEGRAGLDQVAGREPTPAFAAMVVDECRHLLQLLGDESLRQVALLRMEGYSDSEIAARLGCGLRTVGRKLELIRKTWMREVAS
jgi:DNA-directed RNA polymerase specialized sigma24 family protein